jgi:hypothetical protein
VKLRAFKKYMMNAEEEVKITGTEGRERERERGGTEGGRRRRKYGAKMQEVKARQTKKIKQRKETVKSKRNRK